MESAGDSEPSALGLSNNPEKSLNFCSLQKVPLFLLLKPQIPKAWIGFVDLKDHTHTHTRNKMKAPRAILINSPVICLVSSTGGEGGIVMPENSAHMQIRCCLMTQEYGNGYSCGSSRLPFQDVLENEEFLRMGPRSLAPWGSGGNNRDYLGHLILTK